MSNLQYVFDESVEIMTVLFDLERIANTPDTRVFPCRVLQEDSLGLRLVHAVTNCVVYSRCRYLRRLLRVHGWVGGQDSSLR